MSVKIHGKEYVTVAERLEMARKDLLSIDTEVIPNGGSVIVKATVKTSKGTFTGISAANPAKPIEKQSPYEVAETSAVGRALGFAGYGAVDGIATADEVKKAESSDPEWITEGDEPQEEYPHHCNMHKKELKERANGVWDHRSKLNESKQYDPNGTWYWCQGNGWHLSANQ